MDEMIINALEGLGSWGHVLLITIELILSALFAGLIGYEREYHGHSAGLRTHILVSIGACLIMIVSVTAPSFLLFDIDNSRDPARLAAQVVSGIGFLGAGTIMKNGSDIKGLTTAATLWLCGGIGLACGSGYFSGAIIATVITLVTLTVLIRIEKRMYNRSPRIVLTMTSDTSLKEVMNLSNTYSISVKDIHSQIIKDEQGNQVYQVTVQLGPSQKENLQLFADELKYRLNPIDFKLLDK